jgi:hypothetical protein
MQGGHKFLSLETGEILVRRKWTELPVPNDIISRLDELSTNPEDDLERFLNEQEDLDEELGGESIKVGQESGDFNIESNTTTVDEEDNNIIEERIDNEVDDEIKTGEMSTVNENDGRGDIILHMEPQVEEGLPRDNLADKVMHQYNYNLRPNRTLSYLHKFAFLSVHARVEK